ncbi:hypothetical protein BM536_000090 [Streptomyces phaeoluteigriseus]|uniref:Uncharacterized protein n=1 Tax=Streptomyces phaeoluteigriseus TaxID=114686 RepID=A0A1V6MZQ5_9ACTN|nr:hypothetical protein [Streptomyces phaeoluteigriseus]OQD57855.1 hypothetical protein BM536_000090 [Streptomyces phaeoluteigriseus]
MSDKSLPLIAVADDDILARRILPGTRALKEHLGCSLQDALIAFTDRYEVLRLERPNEFSEVPDEYWDDFES